MSLNFHRSQHVSNLTLHTGNRLKSNSKLSSEVSWLPQESQMAVTQSQKLPALARRLSDYHYSRPLPVLATISYCECDQTATFVTRYAG